METVNCIFCQEQVKKGVTRCPHCKCWQSRWKLSPQHPILLTVFLVALLFVLYPAIYLMDSKLYDSIKRKRSDKNVSQSEPSFEVLKISNSSLKTYKCGERGEHTCVRVLIEIENNSSHMWDNIHTYVELFDSNGVLILALNHHFQWWTRGGSTDPAGNKIGSS